MNLPNDVELWPDLWREAYETRAAHMEYDSNIPRWKAEIMAESDIRKQASEAWEPLT